VNPQNGVLITGATGFVGMEVLARWLERSERPVYALVRADSDEAAEARLRGVLEQVFEDPDAYADRLTAVRGDIQQPVLGLEWDDLLGLAQRVTTIVHCAASVSFTLGLEESRSINVLGTRRMLELAEVCRQLGGLELFSYVSTAYVAGTHAGTFGEDDLHVGQEFRNPYEATKFEAEERVRAHTDRLPVQILRPSIVVGERESGWTSAFNVMYTPLKAFARGAYRVLPAKPSAPVDVVPVDYVADAVFELSSGGDEGTFHLVAGEKATTVRRLTELASRHFRRRPPRRVPLWLYRRALHPLLLKFTRGRTRGALVRSEVFFPYFSMRVHYDDSRARERLERAGVRISPVESYFHRLLDFADRARWGKRPVSRAQARVLSPAASPHSSARRTRTGTSA
jgi:thioester reductase-like protein